MMKKLVFGFVILLCFSVEVLGENPSACNCPDTTIKTREEFKQTREALISNLWNTTDTSWSPLLTEYKEEVHKLFNLKDSTVDQKKYAANSMVLYSILSKILDPQKCLNACTQQAIFGAWIEYNKCHNEKMLKIFDDGILSRYSDSMLDLAVARSYRHLTCPGAAGKSTATVVHMECEDNGYSYDIAEIWDLRGGFLPSSIRELVEKMYNSDDCRHKYLAAAFTYGTLEFVLINSITVDFKARGEFLSYATGPAIPECCCEERVSKMEYLIKRIRNQKDVALTEMRNSFVKLPEKCNH